MMDGATIRAVEASIYAAGYPVDAEAILLIELDGLEAGLEADVARVEGMCSAAGARTVRVARDDAERARLWQGRKKAFGAMGRVSSHLVVQDAVIPRTRLPDVLAVIREIAERQRITVCNVFHAGDGNLHPNIGYDANDPDEQARVHAAMREIMAACVAAGGTITGEHGIGLDKLDYMSLIFSEDSLAAMCRLREVFDPARRANPGKVVPVHSCREWHGAPRAAWTRMTMPASAGPVAGGRAKRTRRRRRRRHRPFAPATPPRCARSSATRSTRKTPLRIVGRGTWLDAGRPVVAARQVSLDGLTGIVDYTPGDLTLTARAGTTLAEIARVTAEYGQWLALTPWGGDDWIVRRDGGHGDRRPDERRARHATRRDHWDRGRRRLGRVDPRRRPRGQERRRLRPHPAHGGRLGHARHSDRSLGPTAWPARAGRDRGPSGA